MTTVTGADYPNAEVIYKGLLAMGLSTNAAAGVAGNIYQESGGNPSSSSGAGGGLFGEEIQNGGTTGGGSMTEQLAALAKYIAANGSIADVNSHASSPTAAAIYFMQRYEKPNVALENEANRVAAATYVAAAAKSGNWGTSAGTSGSTPSGGGSGSGLLSFPNEIINFFGDAKKVVDALMWLTMPASWVRITAFLAGVLLLLIALHAFLAVGEGDAIMPKMPAIVPVPL
jgi:Phage tail lysozyme